MIDRFQYCNSLTEYSRFQTRVVNVGDVPLGGDNPIRVQSMTTTDTMDTLATVEQTIRMVNAGCEYVRITAPSLKEAENLKNIKDELKKRGYNVPLIADIHYTPNAAEVAARIVEKVRINPGNYVDKKKFQRIEYTDEEYKAELERIYERFSPLVKICKEYGTAMRIGANHGSLSDRIMSRYGDTPLGMVESALEFVRFCEDMNYYDIVLSMKASNPQIMVQAYRLLVHKMMETGRNYPLHLGVTEAGDGEDGRIKSALGIGALLEDGLGDTIRVSLTEEPEAEIPVALSLVNRYRNRTGHPKIPPVEIVTKNPFEYERRETIEIENIGGTNVPVVVADYSRSQIGGFNDLSRIGYKYVTELDKWEISDTAADYIYLGSNVPEIELPQSLKAIYDYETWLDLKEKKNSYPLIGLKDYVTNNNLSEVLSFVWLSVGDVFSDDLNYAANEQSVVFVFTTANAHGMAEQRRMFFELESKGVKNPVILNRSYNGITSEEFRLYASTDLGSLLIDGYGDGVWVSAELNDLRTQEDKTVTVNRNLFGILQAARARITKTEYIACPSCGRTLFDLVEVTAKIRKRTEHLKGVKIGIMGCIVNGPGEMADADYGYVGSGVGKITLYKGKEVVRKNIDSEKAVDELIKLIKEDGRWIDPV